MFRYNYKINPFKYKLKTGTIRHNNLSDLTMSGNNNEIEIESPMGLDS